ncbi:MAG: pyridoxal 5'-phosphate synthase glutaminase subunit PdxT [Acholeplasmataceae bacterium]|nr:pyridoxal 5'-phosphate synthase glutaminase subunit PdxT [Acholeplasmataceae bacterium]
MIIGILALQGAFIEHKHKLDSLKINSFYIRNLADLQKPKDGLILPGGESTAMNKLLDELNMKDLLISQIESGIPTFGTCAGMILLAKHISNQKHAFLKVMDITVTRNGYGRQSGSFIIHHEFDGIKIPMTFIRAPYIQLVSDQVKVLSVYDQRIVAARQKNMLVTSFHPELNHDFTIYHYFLNMIDNELTK